MHYKELQKIWEPIFKKLGFRERKFNNWVFEMYELIIVLSLRIETGDKEFNIDMGIIIKKWHSDESLKAPVFDDHDIGQGLYTILSAMGEWEYFLNNLFSYDPDINTDAEVKENSREIARLFLKKVMPHFDKLDVYAWLAEDFEEKSTWKPFLRYCRPSPETDEYFWGLLKQYYLRG